jgi:hypothetical protein
MKPTTTEISTGRVSNHQVPAIIENVSDIPLIVVTIGLLGR